jgi:enoyl-CoA hydratase
VTAPLVVEDRGAARWLWFNRPEVHNAQNVAMLEALDDALVAIETTPAVRVVVLAGHGRSFCSGHDLREMADNPKYAAGSSTTEGRYRQELRLFVRPVARIEALPMPVVCRVQGHCLAAGLMFAAAADFVIAADDASFGSPIIGSLGVNDAEVPNFAWVLGERRAKEVLWLGERMDAHEAQRAGLVNRVVPSDELDATVNDVVGRLAAAPPEALMLSKASFQFLARRQGRDDYAAFHYLTHQLSHQTSEARALLEERVRRLAGGGPVVATHEPARPAAGDDHR